ncbi:hypothetical protein ACIBJC_15330 [Streptomyces sp. NPDC050509]|uniref:hypothetical protein n=1 Tax=Streptomyces sp. NPDC050509 TaxID=3365620 RepID=UPI00378A9A92
MSDVLGIDPTPLQLGQLAAAAYSESTGGRTHDGRPIPAWDDLGASVQAAWIAAATAVAHAVTPLTEPAEQEEG